MGLGIYRIGPMPKFSFLVVGSLALLAAAVAAGSAAAGGDDPPKSVEME